MCRRLRSRGMRVRGLELLMFRGEGVGNIDLLDSGEVRRVFGMGMPLDCILPKEAWRRLVGRLIWVLRRSNLSLGWVRIVRMDLELVIGMVEAPRVLRGGSAVMAILYRCLIP